jgi:hypothetical protein
MKVTKMRRKSTYPMRAKELRSSSVDRICSRGRESRLIEGRIGCKRFVEVRSIGGDSPEMGLTDLAKVEGMIGKRLGRGSS